MSRKLNCAIIFMNNKHGINSLIEFGQDSASVINGIKKPRKTTLCSLRTLLVGLFCGVYHNISEEHYSHVLRWVPRCSSHACAHGPFLLCMHAPPASVCLYLCCTILLYVSPCPLPQGHGFCEGNSTSSSCLNKVLPPHETACCHQLSCV